jgi:hypothetical protein
MMAMSACTLALSALCASALLAPCAALASSIEDGTIVRQFSDMGGKPYTVGYNERSMLVGGKPVLLMSGSAHYVRSTPEMWPEIFAKMKASGLNAVESCECTCTTSGTRFLHVLVLASMSSLPPRIADVFWNYHVQTLEDHTANTPDYTGRGNVTLFLELAAKADLFVVRELCSSRPVARLTVSYSHVRVCTCRLVRSGASARTCASHADTALVIRRGSLDSLLARKCSCAEWPGGGMPDWLREIPGMKARSATQPYQDVCTGWMHNHIEHVRPFFAENGGPIIMTQMENELSGPSNTPYVQWLGELATELKTGLPWCVALVEIDEPCALNGSN